MLPNYKFFISSQYRGPNAPFRKVKHNGSNYLVPKEDIRTAKIHPPTRLSRAYKITYEGTKVRRHFNERTISKFSIGEETLDESILDKLILIPDLPQTELDFNGKRKNYGSFFTTYEEVLKERKSNKPRRVTNTATKRSRLRRKKNKTPTDHSTWYNVH